MPTSCVTPRTTLPDGRQLLELAKRPQDGDCDPWRRRSSPTSPLGNKRLDPGSISKQKLQIETRLKLLACWSPKRYGQRTVVAGDDTAPIVVEVKFDIFGEMLKNLALQRHAEE